MSDKVLISIGKVKIEARLLDTPTARNIKDALPFGCKASTWGEEVFFETPVMAELENDAKDVVKAGEIAFWTEGGCIAIGFGKTPASKTDEIRLATKANIWAHAVTDVTLLKPCKPGDFVFIEMI
ncbi:MAG: cyclophilin-like fold protein [Gammaproteobacteria bacterium]|nr:cyclophilin-like fold protein [Gammaproteobacteria bacterium]